MVRTVLKARFIPSISRVPSSIQKQKIYIIGMEKQYSIYVLIHLGGIFIYYWANSIPLPNLTKALLFLVNNRNALEPADSCEKCYAPSFLCGNFCAHFFSRMFCNHYIFF